VLASDQLGALHGVSNRASDLHHTAYGVSR
jgi:hypothetical protein